MYEPTYRLKYINYQFVENYFVEKIIMCNVAYKTEKNRQTKNLAGYLNIETNFKNQIQ